MEFSEWLRSKRLEKKMDQRALAQAANVDRGTISRIETGETAPMFWTAVRIQIGLGISYEKFAEALGINLRIKPNLQEENKTTTFGKKAVLDFVRACANNPEFMRQFFDVDHNLIWRYVDYLDRELFKKRISEKEWKPITGIEYPPLEEHEKFIKRLSAYGDAIIFPDIGPYIKLVRINKKKSLADLEKETHISDTELLTVEKGDMESVKLLHILALEHSINDGGFFWEVCWKAARLMADLDSFITRDLEITDRQKQKELKSASSSLIVLDRWLYYKHFPFNDYIDYQKLFRNGITWPQVDD